MTIGAALDYGYLKDSYIVSKRSPPSSSQLETLTKAYALYLEVHGAVALANAFESKRVVSELRLIYPYDRFDWLVIPYILDPPTK